VLESLGLTEDINLNKQVLSMVEKAMRQALNFSGYSISKVSNDKSLGGTLGAVSFATYVICKRKKILSRLNTLQLTVLSLPNAYQGLYKKKAVKQYISIMAQLNFTTGIRS